MNVNLEQSLAAVVRFIQDNLEEGTQLYFDEIPENFYVPSVYFQIPYSAGRKATLSSYCTTMTMNIWFMAHLDWDAQAVAASMRDEIMLHDCQVPIVDEDGKVTGKALRVTPPTTRKVDEGIVQLSLSFDVYFQPKARRTKMQKFYLAWQNAKQEIQNRRL